MPENTNRVPRVITTILNDYAAGLMENVLDMSGHRYPQDVIRHALAFYEAAWNNYLMGAELIYKIDGKEFPMELK